MNQTKRQVLETERQTLRAEIAAIESEVSVIKKEMEKASFKSFHSTNARDRLLFNQHVHMRVHKLRAARDQLRVKNDHLAKIERQITYCPC